MTGFEHLRGCFDLIGLEVLEDQIEALYLMQAHKIAEYRKFDSLIDVLNAMEGKDKEALYQVQKYLPQSPICTEFFGSSDLLDRCSNWLDVEPELLLVEGPALFVSRPNTTRLLYKWHSEAHYYPKRRKFVNLWFPIFTDRTEENGAMHLLPGSHKEQWDFAEYNSGPNTFVQYEIPADWLCDYDKNRYICESKRGDLIMFDRNLVHRSAENRSKDYAFAVVARVWYPGDDLTLSGSMAATPYGGDIGRAGLVADR